MRTILYYEGTTRNNVIILIEVIFDKSDKLIGAINYKCGNETRY